MNAEHEQLVDQYKENEKVIDKSFSKILVLEAVMAGIIVYMKNIQETASLPLNIVATCSVFCILCWHFLDFYPHRALYEKSIQIVLNGLNIERGNPFEGLSFFSDYLEKFNSLREILKMVICDLIFVSFFSVSFTQLLQTSNPELVVSLRSLTPISTAIINLSLGWAYYKVVRVLVPLQREMAK